MYYGYLKCKTCAYFCCVCYKIIMSFMLLDTCSVLSWPPVFSSRILILLTITWFSATLSWVIWFEHIMPYIIYSTSWQLQILLLLRCGIAQSDWPDWLFHHQTHVISSEPMYQIHSTQPVTMTGLARVYTNKCISFRMCLQRFLKCEFQINNISNSFNTVFFCLDYVMQFSILDSSDFTLLSITNHFLLKVDFTTYHSDTWTKIWIICKYH